MKIINLFIFLFLFLNYLPATVQDITFVADSNSIVNHQAIIEFKGQWYFIYHNGGILTQGGSFGRSVCIDRLYYNPDETMKRIRMTSEGLNGELRILD